MPFFRAFYSSKKYVIFSQKSKVALLYSISFAILIIRNAFD